MRHGGSIERMGSGGKGGNPKEGRYYRSRAPMKTLKRLLKVMHEYRFRILLVVILNITSSLATVGNTYMLRPVINDYILPLVGKQSPDLSSFIGILAVMAGLAILAASCSFAAARIMIYVSSGTMKKIRTDLFSHVQKLPVSYFDSKQHGEIMSHFTNDTDTLRELISNALPNLISSVISITGVIVMMILLSWQLFLLVMVHMTLILFIIRTVGSRSSLFFRKNQGELAALNGYIEEMIEGQKVVKVFSYEEEAKARFDAMTENLYHVASKANLYAIVVMPILGNLSYLHYTLTAVFGAYLTIHGILDIGTIGAFLQYTRTFTQPINQISQQINTILMALAGAERIFDLLDEPIEIDEGKIRLVHAEYDANNQLVETSCDRGFCAWKEVKDGEVQLTKLDGDVRFNNVSFSYVPGQLVLDDISLYARNNQKIAFVGSTGAGKTTIVNLINRFYEITEGEITYDGINIQNIKKDDLRNSISMVLQDTHLFTDTVMENIRYGNLDATDEEVIQAAKLANADSFIRHLPNGYRYMITADGENLSQGQRQLLAIARAAVKNPEVLILDEATSSVDTRTEALIEKGMDQLMDNRTVFVIAHRLSTVRNSDAILVLEHGKIIERGNHEALLEMKGRYYQLYTGIFELS
jgi:ATP-binding cassette subfamily B multidrug efflux pump